jgi:hypothetical protein
MRRKREHVQKDRVDPSELIFSGESM